MCIHYSKKQLYFSFSCHPAKLPVPWAYHFIILSNKSELVSTRTLKYRAKVTAYEARSVRCYSNTTCLCCLDSCNVSGYSAYAGTQNLKIFITLGLLIEQYIKLKKRRQKGACKLFYGFFSFICMP